MKENVVLQQTETPRYQMISTADIGYSLRIAEPVASDCGKFTCVAENLAGVALCSACLHPPQGLTNLEKLDGQ